MNDHFSGRALTGWVDLSGRAKFRLTGPDRVRYLNGQVTNNVARLKTGETLQALVCTAKGRLEGEVMVRAEDDCFLLDAPGVLREALLARLEKYLIADDCAWEDVTDAFALWHGFDERAGAASVDRFGVVGRDVWLPAGSPSPGAPVWDESALDLVRLAHRVPVWGAELTPETLPQEARMEDRAVDFHKGCYVGQEVVSRLRSVGRVNRLLCTLETVGGASASLVAGDRLYQAAPGDGADWSEVGVVTSARHDPRRGVTLAMGYVKRPAIEGGAGIFQAGPDKNTLSTIVKCGETPAGPL